MNTQEILGTYNPARPIVLGCIEAACGVIIAPSAKCPGMMQASYFSSESLFELDRQFESVSEAVEFTVEQGYQEDGQELLRITLATCH